MTEEPMAGKAAAEETAAAEGSGQPAVEAEGTGKPAAAGERTGKPAAAGERPSTDGTTRGTRRRGNRRAVSPGTGGPAGLLPIIAKEDDPRAWGDSTEDSESWLREQRPPHWG